MSSRHPLLHLALAALLAGSAPWSAARPAVSVDLSVGLPIYGTVSPALPAGAVYIGWHRGMRYWYSGGLWYQPWGPSWVVVAPPMGVVSSPAEAAAVTPAPPARPDPVIYPRNGQGAEQTERDRQECNRWAVTQPQAVADASVFQRAIEACMDGRGYSMK